MYETWTLTNEPKIEPIWQGMDEFATELNTSHSLVSNLWHVNPNKLFKNRNQQAGNECMLHNLHTLPALVSNLWHMEPNQMTLISNPAGKVSTLGGTISKRGGKDQNPRGMKTRLDSNHRTLLATYSLYSMISKYKNMSLSLSPTGA